MSGKEPVWISLYRWGKIGVWIFLATIELQVFLLFSVDAKVEAQYKNNLSVH